MKQKKLGATDIFISPIGLGTLTMGPFQMAMPVDEGAKLVAAAVKRGINIIDTAKAYEVYPYVKTALQMLIESEKENLCIIGRSYDYSETGMEESFNEALSEMRIDKISIFMLHQQESALTLLGHRDALKYLDRMKKEGRLKASGISTHHIAAVRAAAEDPLVDVIFAILNRDGLGILDGTGREMEEALRYAESRGKGILLMKALGGGHLFRDPKGALEYARDLPFVHSVILGMQDTCELDFNISIFNGTFKDAPPQAVLKKRRKLFIEAWCQGCGRCVEVCPFNALTVKDNRAFVDEDRCMLCSYCAGGCPDFCIKVV